MFGIGFAELLVVLVVALLVIGPDKLPEVARTLAKAFNEFKRTTHDIKRTVSGIDLAGSGPPASEPETEVPSTGPLEKEAAAPKRRARKAKGGATKKTKTAKGRKAGPAD
ncbi:MAG: twin-arginine translocase TatA/TatE family subunit [Thermodesulfobacteriota bacterium]